MKGGKRMINIHQIGERKALGGARITEWLRLGGTSGDLLVQLRVSRQGLYPGIF